MSGRPDETYCHFVFRQKPQVNAYVKKLARYLAREQKTNRQTNKQTMDHDHTNCNWCTCNNLQRIGKGTERFGNEDQIESHPNYGIIKIGQEY